MANHIVLFEPLIPANTGNIARTCAATNSYLHLIKPLGFETDDKHLRRAGLDYWQRVRIIYHDSLDDFMATLRNPNTFTLLLSLLIRHTQTEIMPTLIRIIISFLAKRRRDYRKASCAIMPISAYVFP